MYLAIVPDSVLTQWDVSQLKSFFRNGPVRALPNFLVVKFKNKRSYSYYSINTHGKSFDMYDVYNCMRRDPNVSKCFLVDSSVLSNYL